MRVFIQKPISLVSTDVAASTYSEYASGTTYGAGTNIKVSYESDGRTPLLSVLEFRSLASTTGDYPPDNLDKWSPRGVDNMAVCNRDACLDGYINTKTSKLSSMEYVLDVSGTNAVGLFNVQAKTVSLDLAYDSDSVATNEESLIIYPEKNWWSYFNNDLEWGQTILWTYPRFSSSELTLAFDYYPTEKTGCGMIIVGTEKFIGLTEYGAKMGMRDYGMSEIDSLGRISLSPGSNYSRTRSIELLVDHDQVDLIEQRLVDIRGMACIFDCNNPGLYDRSLIIYGYYRDFYIIIEYPTMCKCVLEVEGMI